MSQFAFIQSEWADVYNAAVRAEVAVYRDARTACFYVRRALELAVAWTSTIPRCICPMTTGSPR